jgi:DNA-binding NtrC family response regulator
MAKILMVDDDRNILTTMGIALKREGHEVDLAENYNQAVKHIGSAVYDIVITDLRMEEKGGIDVLKSCKEISPDTEVIVLTAFGSLQTAIEALREGASDYILKPCGPDQISHNIDRVLEKKRLLSQIKALKKQVADSALSDTLVGKSPVMQSLKKKIALVADTDATVMITGETGTGKGLAAKALHTNSPRSSGPFVIVSCGAIPGHLMESELFGHQKGAFTDAKETKKGRLEMAHGGTLFLDEIGEISMRMQIDLLQVLEDRIFYRVGGTQPLEVYFRVIAATNRNLEDAIKDGIFREDLFYRLNVISFKMSTLRERKEDIPLLAEYFLHRYSQETNKPVDRISREAMDEMMLYEWPGNVRELENAIERAVVVTKGRTILPTDLPIFRSEHITVSKDNTLKGIEKAHIIQILNENQWNIAKSSKVLSIDRSTLYSKIKRYKINKPA